MYDDYDYYNEPSEFDEKMEELKESLLNSVKGEHKEKMERLEKENERLLVIEEEMKQSKRKYDDELLKMSRDKESLKRDVVEEFYKTTLEDVMKKYLTTESVFYPEYVYLKQEKCNLCNDDRILVATLPNGKVVKQECDCNKNIAKREPGESKLTYIEILKRDGHPYDRKFSLTSKRSYDRNIRKCLSTYEMYDSMDFRLDEDDVFETFNDEAIKKYETIHYKYDRTIGFTTKEECQKFCDYLNALKG